MTIHKKYPAQQEGEYAESQIEIATQLLTHPHTKRVLPCTTVILYVTIVVHDKQRVNYQTTCKRGHEHLECYRLSLYVICNTYGNDTEEYKDEDIPETEITEVCGIKKTKYNRK